MSSQTMEVLAKGSTRVKQSNATAVQSPSGPPPKTYKFKVKRYEEIKYYELPETAIPRGWTNDPLLLQDVPTAQDLQEDYGFRSDIEDTIAIVESNDGDCRLVFEVRFEGQAHFYHWNPIASVLRSVSGGDNINDLLDALGKEDKGYGIVGPEVPYRTVKRSRTSMM